MEKLDVEWYCDNCDAHLNKQKGFINANKTWKCRSCGYENDITENNIFDDETSELIRNSYVTCPKCKAHMKRIGINNWFCPDCNCKGFYDYAKEELTYINCE